MTIDAHLAKPQANRLNRSLDCQRFSCVTRCCMLTLFDPKPHGYTMGYESDPYRIEEPKPRP